MEEQNIDFSKELRSDLWSTLDLYDLWKQEILLNERINFAAHMNNQPLLTQMQRGLMHLQQTIKLKEDESRKKHNVDSVTVIKTLK